MIGIQRDITRTVLAVLFIGALIGTSLWIVRPFLGATIWAVTIVTATWPLMISIQSRLWGRRSLAVAVMTVVLLCVLVIPLWLAIGTIVSNSDEIAGWVKSMSAFEVPPPPAWLARLPLFGGDLVAAWEKVALLGAARFYEKAGPIRQHSHPVVCHGSGWFRGPGPAISADCSVRCTPLRQG